MRGCVLLFGPERGDEIEEMLTEALGEPCPCRQGRPCILLPAAPPGLVEADG